MRNSRYRSAVALGIAAALSVLVAVVAAPAASAGPATPDLPTPMAATSEVVRVPAILDPTCEDIPALIAAAQRDGREFATCVTLEGAGALPPTVMAAPVPPPSNCGTQGYYTIARFWACGVFLSRLVFIDPQNGAVTGTLEYGLVDYSYSSNKSANWMHQVQWDFQSATGVGLTYPQTISGRSTCSGTCYVNTTDFPTQSAAVGRQADAETLNTTTATTTGAIGRSTSTTYWHFDGSNGESTEGSVTAPQIRCDNAMPGPIGPGCVWEMLVPALQYSQSGARGQVAAHISQAQTSGLPGSGAGGSYLHRLTNQTQISANRSTACGSPPPAPLAPATNSCDEYPFASTYEGAWTGGGSARTQAGCYYLLVSQSTGSNGYSICSVDGSQNSNAGTDLGNFYLAQRVIDRDPFIVTITP